MICIWCHLSPAIAKYSVNRRFTPALPAYRRAVFGRDFPTLRCRPERRCEARKHAGSGRNQAGIQARGHTHEQGRMADKKRVMGSRQRFVSCEIYDHKMLWVRGVDCGDGYTRRQHCVRPRRPRRSLAVRQAGDKLRAIANRIAITHCAEMKWRRATSCFES